jgi:hypothetical protein
MNQIRKKTFHKERSINQLTNNQKTLKIKSKPNDENLSSKKIKPNPLKISKNNVESKYKRNNGNHKSISLKEDTNNNWPNKLKTTNLKKNIIYNNTCGNNNNKLFSSNLFLTNDTDMPLGEEEKKISKKNKVELNLPELENIFKKKKFKKTIIIDNEGNNNLNLDIKKGGNDYKNILNKKEDNTIISNSINTNTETNSLFTNGSKMEISNNNINNILEEYNIKSNIMNDNANKEKKEEEKRIKEYTKIFNLLNTNIEQFKKMFNININKIPNLNTANIKKLKQNDIISSKNKKILIKSKKSKQNCSKKSGNISLNKKSSIIENSFTAYSNHNLKKNLSEKNLSSSSKRLINNQNIFTVDVRNDIEKNFEENTLFGDNENNRLISSFLESSMQDDFYQSLINKSFNNCPDEEKMVNDEIMSINIDEKGMGENIQDVQNSRIFRGKNENLSINNKKNDKNIDKNNCIIF